MHRKLLSAFLALALAILPAGNFPMFSASADEYEESTDPTAYTYEIIPLLEPFNQYFYVRTDNPDPFSFCFSDAGSVYADADETARISLFADFTADNDLFADVVYEDAETKRVNGGYIFSSFDTDGGAVELQKVTETLPWGEPCGWEDTGVTLTIPQLYDTVDYLIETYAGNGTFFEQMDAIQNGLSSICLYSSSYIRGDLYRKSDFWRVSAFTHTDQSFYILSPYDRKNNIFLFASAIYPYCYDSLGFPAIMAAASKRLNAASSYEQDAYDHSMIHVTYNGETRDYGGQGEGIGQGLSIDKITQYFTFDGKDTITLPGIRELLDYYAQVPMDDDIPREDALTWETVCDTAGSGSWAYVEGGYAYFFKKNDKREFDAKDWENGDSLYFSGSLGYASDEWVDGRYVGQGGVYVPGVTFEKKPDKNIILTDATIPVPTYETDMAYNPETGSYETVFKNVTINETTGALRYYYNGDNTWVAYEYWIFEMFADSGLVYDSYLDSLQLTYEEITEMFDVDGNTNYIPEIGYVFDGSAAPGTPFNRTGIEVAVPDELPAMEDAKAIAEANGLTFTLEDGYYGMCGEDVYWTYLKDSETLLVTGTGDMHTLGNAPWDPILDDAMPVSQLFVGEGVASLQESAFRMCNQLEKVVLPVSLERIGKFAFASCHALTSITIPQGVTSIGANAFGDCTSLRSIAIENPDCEIYDEAETIYSETGLVADVYFFTGTIYGYANSTAQAYADKYAYPFQVIGTGGEIPEPMKLGDVNGDNAITVDDPSEILKDVSTQLFGESQLTTAQFKVADVNTDGWITVDDASIILQYIAAKLFDDSVQITDLI